MKLSLPSFLPSFFVKENKQTLSSNGTMFMDSSCDGVYTTTVNNLLQKMKKAAGRMMAVLFVFALTTFDVNAQTVLSSKSANGNYTTTIPAGVTSITVQAWGAGGGGGGNNNGSPSSTGGGGGAYTTLTKAVTPAQIFNFTVGKGGSGGPQGGTAASDAGIAGNNSYFGNTTPGVQTGASVIAVNGGGGTNGGSVGAGGLFSNCTPSTANVAFSGGNGGNYNTNSRNFRSGGGGGSSAGIGQMGMTVYQLQLP